MNNTFAACRQWTRPVIEGLVTFSEDYAVTPLLAEAYEVSDDATIFTFAIRQNVPFHNGAILTADDAVATFDRYLQVTPRKGSTRPSPHMKLRMTRRSSSPQRQSIGCSTSSRSR